MKVRVIAAVGLAVIASGGCDRTGAPARTVYVSVPGPTVTVTVPAQPCDPSSALCQPPNQYGQFPTPTIPYGYGQCQWGLIGNQCAPPPPTP